MPSSSLLSNGRYTVLLTGGGGGVSTYGAFALTGWEADRTRDADGFFVYLRDRDRGTTWSATPRPMGLAEFYANASDPGRVRWTSRQDGIETVLEVCVAHGADVELRRLTLKNTGPAARRLDVTSYAEVVLNQPAAHAAHPAFAKLFVQTELVAAQAALLAWRRPRSHGESYPWLVHACLGLGALEHETDRARWLGRGRSTGNPRRSRRPSRSPARRAACSTRS